MVSKKSKIVITGADGFIGSHLSEKLVKMNYDVTALTLYNSFGSHGWLDQCDKDILNKMKLVQGDIRDPNSMRELLENQDVIFHLASLIAIPYSYFSPDSYLETNVKGTMNILQAAKIHNLKKIIHTSTSEVYGSAKFVPITEDHPIIGQSPYSASKIAADQMAISFSRSFGLPVTIVRPFNTYGPRQSLRAVIPSIILQLLQNKKEINLGSLEPTRDFSFVEDTVNGFLYSLEDQSNNGSVFNFGSGFEISIKDLVKTIAEIMGVKYKISLEKERLRPEKSEVNRLFCSYQKAESYLGWKPVYSGIKGFKKGISRTIEWFSREDNRRKYKTEKYTL